MKDVAALALILGIFWLINSGHFEGLLLGLGLFSVVAVILISRRIQALGGEYEPPVLLTPRLPGYLLWLLGEIVKANIDVVRRVWQRSPDISPTVFTVTPGQKTDVCRVLYANSITMTPGTVTLDVRPDRLEVHALTRAAAEGLQKGEMNWRVSRLEQ